MQAIGKFLASNWLLLAAIIVLIIYLVIRIKKGQWEELRADAYRLMTLAEQQIIGTKKGRQRFDRVVTELYNAYVPGWMKPFVSKQFISMKVQQWFYDIRDILDNIKRDKSAPPVVPEVNARSNP